MQNDENLYHFCLVELPQPTPFTITAPLPYSLSTQLKTITTIYGDIPQPH